MILHTGAFADAVHRPHWAANIDAADAEFRRGDRADHAAAGQVAAVRIALIGNIGFLAPLDKARGAASSRSDDVAMLMRCKTSDRKLPAAPIWLSLPISS